MKKISDIKGLIAPEKILSTQSMLLVKGGLDATTLLEDDKRRERPGGGVTTI